MGAIAAVPERHARFREEKRLGLLQTPLVSTGTLIWRRPDHLEKNTESPAPERLVIDGERMVLTEGRAAPRVLDLSDIGAAKGLVDTLRATLGGDLTGLRRAYDVQIEGLAAGWHLALAPHPGQLSSLVRNVAIDGVGDTPREIRITQTNGDEQRLVIAQMP